MVKRVRPGSRFMVEYADGEPPAEVVCLSINGTEQVIAKQAGMGDGNPATAMKECLALVMPDLTDEFFDTITLKDADVIINKAVAGLDEEELKKLESQPT